ncbi:MAG: hydroxyisourate hydrolase [Candidatus Eisenbacteria bacterium]|uniref:5-hydroxyisourate hydrolase n=1 Tax=Eiseniibacteriota bacterium TaxID=2212470 RepID=A0A9D6QN74_UNCEI|nr:hydroxyisourate hydrolase [Candidatus Eisenbacteria bacterium]MBI3538704.1 hydroxyisourate hydrolase [Candidatus Eisenbacteria bacterium]
MSGITTHVLDTAAGRPARGVPVRLDVRADGKGWVTLAERTTDADGRVQDLLAGGARLDAGRYRLTFGTGAYFAAQGVATFFPEAAVEFEITDATQHYHVPLLVSPFGYSTYRGS